MAQRNCSNRRGNAWIAARILSLLVIAVALFSIISEPDQGGIWDGYVPTWLGGEGPEGPSR